MNLKHGFARKRRRSEYGTWCKMRERCYDSNNIEFFRYGAKGITVCSRWRESFINFLSDMGEKPSPKHSIDRIDGTGNYEPENCRWVDAKTQQRNRLNNCRVTAFGETLTYSEWDERSGFNRNIVGQRIRKGWSPERAITEPMRSYL